MFSPNLLASVAIGNPERHVHKASHRGSKHNRDHAHNLSYYSLLALQYNGVILHAHPVRGETHNQRNTTGEVATQDFSGGSW